MVVFVSFNRSLTQAIMCGSFNIVSLFLNAKPDRNSGFWALLFGYGPGCLSRWLITAGLTLLDKTLGTRNGEKTQAV
jgi:hypothetical protein